MFLVEEEEVKEEEVEEEEPLYSFFFWYNLSGPIFFQELKGEQIPEMTLFEYSGPGNDNLYVQWTW